MSYRIIPVCFFAKSVDFFPVKTEWDSVREAYIWILKYQIVDVVYGIGLRMAKEVSRLRKFVFFYSAWTGSENKNQFSGL